MAQVPSSASDAYANQVTVPLTAPNDTCIAGPGSPELPDGVFTWSFINRAGLVEGPKPTLCHENVLQSLCRSLGLTNTP